MNRRRRVARELLILGALAIGFLLLFPERSVVVDMTLALFGLGLVLLTANYTRTKIWDPLPPEAERIRRHRGLTNTMIPTVLAMIVFLLIGIAIGYRERGWAAVGGRILNWRILIAIALFLSWAWIQQTLLQFYLLGRLRVLWPSLHPLSLSMINGLAFALVHAPDFWVSVMTALGGTAWSVLYLRYRLLWPLALSHALVGSTFYDWVYGRNLAGEWSRVLVSLLNKG